MITEYDNHQLVKMKQQLASFKKDELPLGSLIGDLDFLLNAMESMEMAWKEKVHEEVATLEEVYAVALDSGVDELDEASTSLVYQSIQKLSEYFDDVVAQ